MLNHYRLRGLLGAGGMGEVYEAEDTRLRRNVAIKILPGEAAGREERARFEREARALAAINHPNIVTIHSVEESAGTHFLAMELIDGERLDQLISPGGIPLAALLEHAIPLVDAVSAAHERGVVHRDLKPANVMITKNGVVKVLDFGLARPGALAPGAAPGLSETPTASAPLTGEGRILGTVAYMSPEQAEGKPVDHRSDIFSLGVLLYEMATGGRPFRGQTNLAILSAILKDPPRPLSEVKPGLPRDLDRVVRHCLAKDPERRLQSAKDLRNELQELAAAAREAPARARPAAWTLATAGVALVAAAAYIGMSLRKPSAPAAPTFTRLTAEPGLESWPSLSPDGSWVVYASNASGQLDIFLRGVGGEAAVNLTKDSPLSDTTPAFSPDGRSIAFRSSRDGGGIFVMGRLGESVRRLTQGGFDPTWTADGRDVVYGSQSGGDPHARFAPGELLAVNVASGDRRRISEADAVQPRVSPNGKLVAYWGLPLQPSGKAFAGADRDVWVRPFAGGTPVRVTGGESTDWNPTWSADGRSLYFSSDRSGSMNLWRIAIDPATGRPLGEAQPMTTPALWAGYMSVSADATVAYAAYDFSTAVRAVPFDPVKAAVAGPAAEVIAGRRAWTQPDVSPDGRLLALRSYRAQEDIYVVGTDGAGLRALTNDPASDRLPRWSADGRSILFYSTRGGGEYQFWEIHPDGSGLRQLTKVELNLNYPVPSPDGRWVGGSSPNTGAQYIFDARDLSKPPQRLPPLPEGTGAVYLNDWSPDGDRIAGHVSPEGGAAGAVWLYYLEQRRWERVGEGRYPRWLPDARRLVALNRERVVLLDVVSKQSRELYAEPSRAIVGAALSRDGRRLYIMSAISEADLWLMRFGPQKVRP